jgi:hypothetical protein
VGAQEHAPGSVMSRRRRNSVGAQDLADGGGGYPVAEPTQFALDPDHAPPGVLPGQAHDQRDELAGYRRAARWPGLAPLRRYQALVPAQQRAGRHDPPGPQCFRHDPGQRDKHGCRSCRHRSPRSSPTARYSTTTGTNCMDTSGATSALRTGWPGMYCAARLFRRRPPLDPTGLSCQSSYRPWLWVG